MQAVWFRELEYTAVYKQHYAAVYKHHRHTYPSSVCASTLGVSTRTNSTAVQVEYLVVVKDNL